MGARDDYYDDEEEEEQEREPEEEEGDRADDDDEEEEEEGQDEYEKDDFIVDDDEEEDAGQDEEAEREEKARKKKRKKREKEMLDEDDYELLDEAGVRQYKRPANSQFKRLKKAGRAGAVLSDEEEDDDGRRRGRTAEEKLKLTLFGDEEAPPEDVPEEDRDEEDDIGEEDEMADFIVDEEELDENGQPLRAKKSKKKKMARQATQGVSSAGLQEAQEIFGDVTQLLEDRRMRVSQAERQEDEDDFGSKKRLEKEFEPSVLEEKYMTESDDRIRDTDIAERLQYMAEVSSPLSPEVVAREAEWVYDRAFGRLAAPWKSGVLFNKPDAIKQIANVIQLLHDQKVEVPFIGMYRKEMCKDLIHEEPDTSEQEADARPNLRRYNALWAVKFWDKKWWLLQRRKSSLRNAYEKRAGVEPSLDDAEFLDKLLQALQDAPSDQVVDDIDAKFNLHFPPDEVESEDVQFKRPKRRTLYSIYRKSGFGNVSRHIGLSSEQFGENLQAMYKRHDVENAGSTPEDVVFAELPEKSSDVQSVLQGARHMAAVEISTEPAVREYVRNVYMERAVVSTKPTLEGNRVIDAFHQFGDVKWLQDKPIRAFEDGQWLLIQKAEEEKLLEVTIGLQKEGVASLAHEFEGLYLSDGVSRTAQLWNELRRQIMKDALHTHILPAMEKEFRVVMAGLARQWIQMQCGEALWKMVRVAPYPRPNAEPDERAEDEGSARVLACCWGPGKPATAFVMLDSVGEIVDTLHTGYLTVRNGSYEQMTRKKNDQQRLQQFMIDHQPHVVVLGGANLNCRYLKDDIFEVIFKIVEEHPRELAEGIDIIQQVYGDETIPRLYENSRVSEEQLQQQSGIVRRAVALGRYLQNPLAMIAALCGPSREILSLKLHTLQSFLSPDETYEAIERVMVTITNQVGLDVNMAASHEWMFAPLQFVGGLGPRKAAYIKRAIQGAGRVNSRKEMLTSLELMRKNVFINSSGFIRIRGTGQAANGNNVLDPLEDTRIHPESYEIAKRMAEDAYCEELGYNNDDDETLEMAVDHVRENPQFLKNLDIDEYAKVVQERGSSVGRKYETLQDIKQELQHGFLDWRVKYKGPEPDEVFYLLTQESEETLSEGKIVQATVKKVQQNKVMCMLESGLLGIILRDDLSDDRDTDPSEKVSEGSILTCRIKEVHKAKFLVDLTSKGSDLRTEHWNDRRPRDRYYVQNTTYFQDEEEKARKKVEEQKQKTFKPRMIVHPMFRNISLVEATQALTDRDIGEGIIRPSSKGHNHLSLTLKFYHGLFAHIEITEGGKDERVMTSLLRLGKTLTIGDETFEDLDEVIARYVDPLVSHWKNMFRYRKFKEGTKEEVDNLLRVEKEATPARIPYCFSVCFEHPGVFTLSYIRSVNVHHEYVSVSPKGFRFRQRYFDVPDKLVAYFQKHFNDPVAEAPPRRAAAAMVPSSDRRSSGQSSGRNGWSDGRRSSGWDNNKQQGGGYSSGRRSGWDHQQEQGGGGWGSHDNSGWQNNNNNNNNGWGQQPQPQEHQGW